MARALPRFCRRRRSVQSTRPTSGMPRSTCLQRWFHCSARAAWRELVQAILPANVRLRTTYDLRHRYVFVLPPIVAGSVRICSRTTGGRSRRGKAQDSNRALHPHAPTRPALTKRLHFAATTRWQRRAFLQPCRRTMLKANRRSLTRRSLKHGLRQIPQRRAERSVRPSPRHMQPQ